MWHPSYPSHSLDVAFISLEFGENVNATCALVWGGVTSPFRDSVGGRLLPHLAARDVIATQNVSYLKAQDVYLRMLPETDATDFMSVAFCAQAASCVFQGLSSWASEGSLNGFRGERYGRIRSFINHKVSFRNMHA